MRHVMPVGTMADAVRRAAIVALQSTTVAMDVRADVHTVAELYQYQSTHSYHEPTAVADQHSTTQRVITVDLLADAVRWMAIAVAQMICKHDPKRALKSMSKEPNSCGTGCQSGCYNVTAEEQATLNSTDPRHLEANAENGRICVPLIRTTTSDPGATSTCLVHASSVELLYFPPATALQGVVGLSTDANATKVPGSIAISDGYTFTSPSVYAVYHSVSADYNYVGPTIGTVHKSIIIAYTADAISVNYCDTLDEGLGPEMAWRRLNLTELAYPYPNGELRSRFGCSHIYGDDSYTVMAHPLYSLPMSLTAVDPLYKNCDVEISAHDPPRTLQPVSALTGPTTTPFAPATTVRPGASISSPPTPTSTSVLAAVVPVLSVSGLDPMGMIPPKADPKPSPDPSPIPDPGQNQIPKNTIQSPKPSPGQDHQDPKKPSPSTNTDPGQTNLDPNSAHFDPAASTPSSKEPTQGQSNQNPKLPNPSPNTKPGPVNQDPKPSAASPNQSPTVTGADPGQDSHPASNPNPGNGGQGSDHSDPHPDSVPPPTDANPPNVDPTPVIINGQTLSRLPKATPSPSSPNPPIMTPVVIGDQTFSPGSTPVTVAGTVHSIAAPDGNVIVNGQMVSRPPSAIPPPSYSQVLSIGSQTLPFSVNSASEIVINSQTLHADAPVIVGSHTIALNPSATGNGILVNGQPTSIPSLEPPSPASQHDSGRPPITVAGQTITTNKAGNYVYGSQTLQNGGPAIIVSGTPVSLAPASQITIGGSTIQLSPVPIAPPSIIAGGHPLTTNSAGDFIVGSSTLHPGSPAIIISNTPISLDASASQLIVGGSTIQLLPAFPTPPSLTIGGHPLTTNSAGAYIIASQTLTPGGPALTIASTPLSLPRSATALIVGSSTIPLPPPPSASENPPLVIGSTTIPYSLLPTSSLLLIGSQTLTPGGPALTLSSTPISLAPSGTALIVGSSTIPLSPLSTSQPPLTIGDTTIPYVLDPTSPLLIIASHTLSPGGPALTLSNGVVSAVKGSGGQGVEVVVGSGGGVTTEGLGGAIMSAFGSGGAGGAGGTGGPGMSTGSAGAGGAATSAEGFRGEGGRSGRGGVGMGMWVGIGVGMWVVGWVCI